MDFTNALPLSVILYLSSFLSTFSSYSKPRSIHDKASPFIRSLSTTAFHSLLSYTSRLIFCHLNASFFVIPLPVLRNLAKCASAFAVSSENPIFLLIAHLYICFSTVDLKLLPILSYRYSPHDCCFAVA